VTGSTKTAGVLLLVDGEPRFLAASAVLRVAAMPPVTRVPGAPPELLGIALDGGAILPVLALGPALREMVVCQHEGELLGIVGAAVVRTGLFDVVPGSADEVVHEGRPAPRLDLAALCAAVRGPQRAGSLDVARRA